jgi:hypothetical protein
VKRFFHHLLGTKSIRRTGNSRPRSFKPGFEHLEDRRLMSVSALASSILAPVNPAVYMPAGTVAIDPGLSYNNPGVVAIENYLAAHPELGTPVSTIQPIPAPVGVAADGGLSIDYYNAGSGVRSTVLWSTQTGAHAVTGAIHDKYLQSDGGALGPPSVGLENFGYATDDAATSTIEIGGAATSYVTQHFQYGAIVNITSGLSNLGVFAVRGAIYQEWLNSPIPGVQGLIPISDQNDWVPNQPGSSSASITFNQFVDPTGKRWDIAYVLGDARAHVIEDGIMGKWLALGGTNYGRPDGDTVSVVVPQEAIAGPHGTTLNIGGTVYTQDFLGGPDIGTEFRGTITSTPWGSGVNEMHGVVREVYAGDGVQHFGYNITDELYGDSPYVHTGDALLGGDPIIWAYNITLDPASGKFFRIYALTSTGSEGNNTDSWEQISPDEAFASGATFQTVAELTSSPSMLGTKASSAIPPAYAFPPLDTSINAASSIPAIAFFPSGNVSFAADPWDMSPAALASLAGMAAPASDGSQPQPAPVADLTNVSFTVISDDGTVSHQLVIQSQIAQADGSATFNGVWDPAGADLVVTGTLTADPDGTIHLIFGAADGSNFDSVVSGQASAYHIDGTLTPGDGSAPVHLAGDQDQAPPAAVTPVADLTNISFALTDDNGVAHQLQIQTQTTNPDGSATFTGLWDGSEQVNGTLAYDASGNVHMTFAGSTDSFDGTVTTGAVGYHLDGILTGSDGSSVHVAGDQLVAQVNPVTDLTNVSFALTDDNGVAHQLQIQAQSGQPDGSATFTGLWDGSEQVNGTLAYDASGNVHMTFAGSTDSFDGTVTTGAVGYHLDGILTGSDGSPVHLAGDQAVAPVNPVADFTNVNFALIDDNGTAHQLQIQTQTANPDGSAAFTGVWNGESGTGTLAYDAAGNIHITFSSTDYTFDGTISGAAGAYQIDGTVALPGVDPLHISGAQA